MAAVCGREHVAAVAEDGGLYMWGVGNFGQLGLGEPGSPAQARRDYYDEAVNRRAPTRVALDARVAQVALGEEHTAIVTEAGDLLMCGGGRYGVLGMGDEVDLTTPTLIDRTLFDNEKVRMVVCGEVWTAALTEGGGVFSFGLGGRGQLGLGDQDHRKIPTRVPAAYFNDERIVMLAAGRLHMVALSQEGHVHTCGWGKYGQLGHDSPRDQWVWCERPGGGVWEPPDALNPLQVQQAHFGNAKVVSVAAGEGHTLAVTGCGRLYTWGDGRRGQLGHGAYYSFLVPKMVDAAAFGGSLVVMAAGGKQHSLVVTRHGTLWACGCNDYGQLGLTHTYQEPGFEPDWGDEWFRPTVCLSVFVRVGASVWRDDRIVTASAGWGLSAAVTERGSLFMWGIGLDADGEPTACRIHEGVGLEFGLDGDTHPTLVAPAALEGVRIGRCRDLLEELTLALAMGMHARLGSASAVRHLGGELELLFMIVDHSSRWVAGPAGKEEGVVRLIGGGFMLDSVKLMQIFPVPSVQASEEEQSKLLASLERVVSSKKRAKTEAAEDVSMLAIRKMSDSFYELVPVKNHAGVLPSLASEGEESEWEESEEAESEENESEEHESQDEEQNDDDDEEEDEEEEN